MRRLVRTIAFGVALLGTFGVSETAHAWQARDFTAKPLTCGGLEVTIVGTDGDDVINGTNGNDVIAGLGGNDTIRGGDGEDVICGGPGDDYIEGQGDEDILFGDEGDDWLDGGEAGCCNVATNTGDDVLSGGPGNDVLQSSDFPQAGCSLYGDQGQDILILWTAGQAIGAQGFVSGGAGNDTIYQITGDAMLDGGGGDDIIVDLDDGGTENETITMIGGKGHDLLISFDASSTVNMDGGPGWDACVNGTLTSNCEG
jgi:Ca2+-binding RTX toxin-like protein